MTGRHLVWTFVAVALGFALTAASGVSGARGQASGTLQIDTTIATKWRFGDYCPPGAAQTTECVRFVGDAEIRGLGRATSTYTKTLEENGCDVTQFKTAAVEIAGKGVIYLSHPETVCGPYAPAQVGPLTYTITGGSGTYAGASGTFEFRSSVFAGSSSCRCGSGSDSWRGTLTVPGLEYDLTAPTLAGTISKTVRVRAGVRRARVLYAVRAEDAVDGVVPVTCSPRSGSTFPLGRTKVSCEATDSSGNTAKASFTVTVRRR